MNIAEYIQSRNLERVAAVPPRLAHKFDLADDVQFYSDAGCTRYVGICKARNFFAAWKAEAITTGELDKVYATLRSF